MDKNFIFWLLGFNFIILLSLYSTFMGVNHTSFEVLSESHPLLYLLSNLVTLLLCFCADICFKKYYKIYYKKFYENKLKEVE